MMGASLSAQQIPAPVLELCRVFARHGHRAWIVGGCLRDLLRGKAAADWDLATDAHPTEIQGLFPKVIPTGIQHGTVTVRHRGQSYEVTTLRGEGAYSDGRRPDSVQFVSEIEADLARRDFTINAMAYDPLREEVSDPFGGIADLERGLLRAVGEPAQRFAEDGLRVLRAARFGATLEVSIEAATEAAIGPSLGTFAKVSAERVRDEWMKALRAREPSRAFRVMKRTGILGVCCPLLDGLAAPELERSLRLVDGLGPEAIVRLTGLLSPLAAALSAVDAWLVAYRFSNAERELVGRLLRERPVLAELSGDEVALRRYACRVGRSHVRDVVDFAQRSAICSGEEREAAQLSELLVQLTALLARKEVALSTRELTVTGSDLMKELGLAPGPILGKLLDALLKAVIEQPALNERASLLSRARELLPEL